MTAYINETQQTEWGTLTWEVKTVNHRYLEINFRVPELFRQLEPSARQCIKQQLQRGKVDVYLKFLPGEKLPFDFTLNQDLLTKLAKINQKINSQFANTHMNIIDLLNWQGVLQTKEVHIDLLEKVSLELLQAGLVKINEQRQREGEGLKKFLQQRLNQISTELLKVKEQLPQALQLMRDKITTRFAELKLEIDQSRIEQEMVWLVQKSDIAEELQRLQAHIKEVERILTVGDACGRRLDFLMQELNREANTLASKSINTTITRAALEMKVCIEQMREQVQNIE